MRRFILAFILSCLGLSQAALTLAEVGPEIVTVDFGSDAGPAARRASGFLLSLSATQPTADLVLPLRMNLFRTRAFPFRTTPDSSGFAVYERLHQAGTRVQIILSDSQGYRNKRWPGDGGDWSDWEQSVTRTVSRAEEKGYHFEWDIWNEPNEPAFWGRSLEQWLETWRRAYVVIRRLEPDAIIVGPSHAGYRPALLRTFLDYAAKHQVLPDLLSWHEMPSFAEIPGHVAEMRAYIAERHLTIKDICINEMISAKLQTQPGATVGFLAAMEQARVAGACHACWPDRDPRVSNCWNWSLNGLLTHPARQPRSTWWAYKAYADISGRLVEVKPSATVVGLAGFDDQSCEGRMLLGRHGETGDEIRLNLSGLKLNHALARNGKLRVLGERIPDSGWEALAKPVVETNTVLTIVDGQCQLVLPRFGPSDAYTLRVSTAN